MRSLGIFALQGGEVQRYLPSSVLQRPRIRAGGKTVCSSVSSGLRTRDGIFPDGLSDLSRNS
jgi:hypothetical protein